MQTTPAATQVMGMAVTLMDGTGTGSAKMQTLHVLILFMVKVLIHVATIAVIITTT
jgi:hypothetical protein